MFGMDQIQRLLDPKLVEQNAALFAQHYDPTTMAPFFTQLGQDVQVRAMKHQQEIQGAPLTGPGDPQAGFSQALGTGGGMGQGMPPANPALAPQPQANPAATMQPAMPQGVPAPTLPGMVPASAGGAMPMPQVEVQGQLEMPPAVRGPVPPTPPGYGFSGSLGMDMPEPNPGAGYPQPGYAAETPDQKKAKKDEKKVGALTVDQLKMLAAMTAPPEEKFAYAVAPGKGGDQVKLGQHGIGGARGVPSFAQIFGR